MTKVTGKIYGRDFQAFVERAYLSIHGRKLNASQPYLGHLIRHVELFHQGETRNLLVNLPGRHLKTFLFSVCFPAFALGLDPTRKFLVVAYSEKIAEDIVRLARDIMESKWYRAAFDTRIAESHSRKDDFAVTAGGRIQAAPIGSLSGKGGDIMIFDDPHNAREWNNDKAKLEVIANFELLMSRRDHGQDSQVLVVGHRVAVDDLSAHIIDRGGFVVICLPLFAPKTMICKVKGSDPLCLEQGEALRPDSFPPEEIERLRTHHLGPPFSLYYLQGIGSAEDEYQIDDSHFPAIPKRALGNIRASGIPVILSVDPAQKSNSRSRNVIHVYAVLDENYALLQSFAEKCPFSTLFNTVRRFYSRYEASLVLVENTARGPDLIDKLSQHHIQTRAINPIGSKMTRLRKCAHIIRAGRLLMMEKPAVEEAIEEIVAFPNCDYDDHVDTMTNFLLEVPHLDLKTLSRAPGASRAGIAVAYGSHPPQQFPETGAAMLRHPSVFQGIVRHPAEMSQSAPGAIAPVEFSEPIISFDGKKIVRLKVK